MRIKRIKKIKNYKSFRDYRWQPFLNNDNLHDEVNIFYGENGCGKTSICNILKSISSNRDFTKYLPEETELLINATNYSYTNDSWDRNIPRSNILFFDREFIEENIHLGKSRGTQQGEQEQASGKLIIEFDANAISLRELRDKAYIEKEEKNAIVQEFKKQNSSFIGFELDDQEEALFRKYKNKKEEEITFTQNSLNDLRRELDTRLETDKKLLAKAHQIESIEELEELEYNFEIYDKDTYRELFDFELKEKAKISAEADLVEKLKTHSEFFEEGFSIREDHPNKCPFCQSTEQEDSIKRILKIYNQIYDDSYRNLKKQFNQNKESLKNDLQVVINVVDDFDPSDIFLPLKKIAEKYSVKNLYKSSDEEKYSKDFALTQTKKLLAKVTKLEKPTKEDITKLYESFDKEVAVLAEFFEGLAKLVEQKNKIIRQFKKDNTDQKLESRIQKDQTALDSIIDEIAFISSGKISKQKQKNLCFKTLDKHIKALEKAKTLHSEALNKYINYCSGEAFKNALEKIESFFAHFDFNFTLSLATTERHTSSTKEIPFAFNVVDLDGSERDLKEGLSEGEIQVLSLCFFFAFLDIQNRKDQKILVFDDPITSLDDSNLSCLVDLISGVQNDFSQTLIFTHHRTFLKFLRKKFARSCNEYNIIRNKNHLGGSFLCKSVSERFITKLQNFEQHLLQAAQGQGYDVEMKIIEYGQYLRYEIENFVKCRLLHLDEIEDFPRVIEGIKENKNVTDEDLNKIKNIYSFCNWTTAHVDVGDDHGLSQLKTQISDFIGIQAKY